MKELEKGRLTTGEPLFLWFWFACCTHCPAHMTVSLRLQERRKRSSICACGSTPSLCNVAGYTAGFASLSLSLVDVICLGVAPGLNRSHSSRTRTFELCLFWAAFLGPRQPIVLRLSLSSHATATFLIRAGYEERVARFLRSERGYVAG